MNYFINIIAGFFSGMLGAMGMGGGGILIIFLRLFENMEQKTAQGINLMFFIPSAIIAVVYYIYKKMIDFKVVGLVAVFGLIGAFIGFYISNIIEQTILSKIFGILLLAMGVKQILSRS